MKIHAQKSTDVIVVGSGLAGITAACRAAEKGAGVILLSTGPLFSGSSFFPGTWGLGLISAADCDDEQDLCDTINAIGCNMTDKELVKEFVSSIPGAISWLEGCGVKLKTAHNSKQDDFIPCFDHKHRTWNGLLSENVRKIFSDKIKELGIEIITDCTLTDILSENGRVKGAVIYRKDIKKISLFSCSALILAAGGFTTLFKDHVTTNDVSSCAHIPALKTGCELVNMEFMQIMPAYRSPCRGTIFNEKVFRYVDMTDHSGKDLIKEARISEEVLAVRSTHGPFTSSKISCAVDLMIAHCDDDNGVTTTYSDELKNSMSEFAQTYFEWLKEKKHLTVDDTINIGLFAHASNGGIKIDSNASCGPEGLYACGEITGGMHGADRIGGLSTANGLVFGLKAGENAARYSLTHNADTQVSYTLSNFCICDTSRYEKILAGIMSENCMVIRSGKRLENAVSRLEEIIEKAPRHHTYDHSELSQSMILQSRLELSLVILKAALLREESRGSHYREDFPVRNESLSRRIIISQTDNKYAAQFENK